MPGHVPTEVYGRALKRHGEQRKRIDALEAMLLDAWLACQGSKVLPKRMQSWKSVLDDKLQEPAATGEEQG